MSDKYQITMRQWAKDHGRAVRQRTVKQNNMMHSAGTLPLLVYQKDISVGEDIQLEDLDSEVASRNHKNQSMTRIPTGRIGSMSPRKEMTSADVDVNFLAKTIRTQPGRVIGLSKRALQSYSS